MWLILCLGLAFFNGLLDLNIPLENHLDKRSKLGRGEDGEVFNLKGQYALKIYPLKNFSFAQREFINHQNLDSPFFVKVYELFQKRWHKQLHVCLLREYVEGHQLVRARFDSAQQLGQFLVQVTKVWEVLLEHGLMWEDFHCGNLLVTRTKNLKAIDLSRCFPIEEAEKISLRAWAAKLQNIARLSFEITRLSPQKKAFYFKQFKKLKIERPHDDVKPDTVQAMQAFLAEFSALGSVVSNDQKEKNIWSASNRQRVLTAL